MPRKIIILNISVAITLLLASCARTTIENIQPDKTPAPSEVSATKSASVPSLAQTLISNSNYLRECKTINRSKLTEQIPYKDIWPGKTRESQLVALLGAPDEAFTIKGVTNWVYGGMGLFIEEGVVTEVLVQVDQQSGLTLEQLVLKYGCPDIVFAINTTEDQVGYTGTRFIYYGIGIEFYFMNYPVKLADVPDNIAYFQPMGLQEYLKKNGWTVMGIQSGRPIEWTEALK